MDKTAILCAKDRDILHDFSGRCLDRLPGTGVLCLPIPFLRTYLNANVEKESDKDRLVIVYTAACCKEGRACSASDVDALFEQTKEVDRVFLRKVMVPSLSLSVRYEEIAPLRKARIARLTRMIYDLLTHWNGDVPVENAVRAAYAEQDFRSGIAELFHYYNEETRMLSESIRLFGPLQFALNSFAGTLFGTMDTVAKGMIDSCVRTVYRRRKTA